jgi:hypothetical protein
MLKKRIAAVESVKKQFLAAEAAQDDAAIAAVRTVAAMLEARRDAKVPFATGLREIQAAAKAAALSLEARQIMIEAHPGLAALPAQIGLATMYGDVDECPPTDSPRAAIPLKAVA